VDEIKSLLKSILKGKTKEVDSGDLIIDWLKPPKAAGRDTIEYGRAGPSSPKQGRKAGLSLPYGKAGPSSSKSYERAGPKRSQELVIPPKKSKKKLAHRSRSASRSSKSESESSDRSGRSSSSSSSSSPSPSPSPPHSPSPFPTGQIFIRFDDMNRDLRNALRVSILFVYLPNCILTIFIYD
jgi:hypothetical protein